MRLSNKTAARTRKLTQNMHMRVVMHEDRPLQRTVLKLPLVRVNGRALKSDCCSGSCLHAIGWRNDGGRGRQTADGYFDRRCRRCAQ